MKRGYTAARMAAPLKNEQNTVPSVQTLPKPAVLIVCVKEDKQLHQSVEHA